MGSDGNTKNDNNEAGDEFDEYLWPLTDATWPLDWSRLADEHRLRQRLDEILTHVEALHVTPRLRRLGANASATARLALTQSIIAGPLDGQPWERTLREPIPRALREEWQRLGAELRALRTVAERRRA
jgi:hypothetical protein